MSKENFQKKRRRLKSLEIGLEKSDKKTSIQKNNKLDTKKASNEIEKKDKRGDFQVTLSP